MSDPEVVEIHEAGHAVVAHMLGFEVAAVSIRSAEGVDGFVDMLLPPLPDTPKLLLSFDRQSADDMLLAVLAGPAAETRWAWAGLPTPTSTSPTPRTTRLRRAPSRVASSLRPTSRPLSRAPGGSLPT
jgi:hypothetical protein